MSLLVNIARKGPPILISRLRTQGLRVTLIWLYARIIPTFTGVPVMKYSRVTPEIYVGSQYRKAGKRKLESLGIGYCVNMRIEFDSAEHGLALDNYCHLPTIDDDAPTLEHLDEGVAFIERAVTDGGKVYIHCAGGVGRAPTMAAAYFISQGYSLENALGLIRKARPFISPMPSQIEQLKRFEAIQLEKRQRA